MIPYGRQSISQKDIDAVTEVLNSDFLTQGPVVPLFEQAISSYCAVKYGVAVNSATSALHIACLSLGVKKGSLVWTSAISFVASANCALYCGADVDFIDIDEKTINVCPLSLQEKLAAHKSNHKPLPDVVIVVHMAGQSCDMKAIYELSNEYGFSIIEDASHGIGGKYEGHPIGNCRYSDITIFSFHPVKIITTGEGGMAVTNSTDLSAKMGLYRSHGITRDENFLKYHTEGPWYYEQIELGFNYRMTEMQAALGLSQLKNLDEFVVKRTAIFSRYNKELTHINGVLPFKSKVSEPSWHLYILQLDVEKLDRKTIFNILREKGLGVNVHYRPIYLNPYYESLGFKKGLCPNAEMYYEKCISIPIYHGMSDVDQDEVIKTINEICS
jgi:UDP-4-amino-4,6-dideoxy-N-acetyl-beta-L-altrosamine transaminase